MSERTRRGVMIPAASLLVLFGLAACGGNGDAAAEADRPSAERPPAAATTATAPADRPDAYAPRVEIRPEHEEEAGMEVMFARYAEIPGRDEVAIPPYPGARVVQVQPAGEMTLNQETFTTLPVIVLVTEDSPEEVVAFYRSELPDWGNDEILLNHWFWEGTGDFHPLEPSGMQTPAVGVLEPHRRALFPQAATEIQVRYQSR